MSTCPNQDAADFEDVGAVVTETFPVLGALGSVYGVTFRFNAVSEAKYYEGGSWARADTDEVTPGGAEPKVDPAAVSNATFYIGGVATRSSFNTMRMRVLDPTKKEIARYYMNAFGATSGAESHRTFLLAYQHTIDVPGQGLIELRTSDPDCRAVDNCGVIDTTLDAAPSCKGRNIPNENNVMLPPQYTDVTAPVQPHLVPTGTLNPVTGIKQPWHAQLGHITVTKVVLK